MKAKNFNAESSIVVPYSCEKGKRLKSGKKAIFSLCVLWSNKPFRSNDVCSINDIKDCGWISCRLNLGELIDIRDEGNRIVLEFKFKETIYDAISYPPYSETIRDAKLQVGNSYEITHGDMYANINRFKYSNTTSAFCIKLDLIQGMKEIVWDHVDNEGYRWRYEPKNVVTLQDVQSLIAKNKRFTKIVTNAKISNAEIYQYLGCEVCSTKIVSPDTDGMSYCLSHTCTKETGMRVETNVCTKMNFWLTLTDFTGNACRVVCFHKDFVKFLEANCMRNFCNDPQRGLLFRKLADKLDGQEINCRIQMQRDDTRFAYYGQATVSICQLESINPINFDHTIDEFDDPSSQEPCGSKMDLVEERVDDEYDDSQGNETCDVRSSGSSLIGHEMKRMALQDLTNVGNENREQRATSSRYITKERSQYNLKVKKNERFGFALVINMEFNDDPVNKRRGSPKDVDSLQNMFKYLNIDVTIEQNCSKTELVKIIRRFRQLLIDNNANCCFVVVMSHGTIHHFETGDKGMACIYDDVVCPFTMNEFPEFAGKPKVFIFQMCQKASDFKYTGVSNRNSPEDCIIFKSCSPGQMAARDPRNGSYFIQTLTRVFLEQGYQRNLADLFHEVQKEMKHIFFGVKMDQRNMPAWESFCFSNFKFSVEGQSIHENN